MYPIIRFAKEVLKQRNAPKLGLFDTHVSQHMCWPWDIDIWMEMNNGRVLTLFDMGRFGLFVRLDLLKKLAAQGWMGTVAGSTVRYRKRVRMFDRFEMRTRILGWDARFVYLEQSAWRKGDCTSHILIRTAITDKSGIIPTQKLSEVLLNGVESPALPAWARNWADADATRPWPPQM